MKKLFLSLLLVFITLISAVADDGPKAVIIFDASGSMWGQIQGKTKIEIAKKALENVVQDWNSKIKLGLTVYGHRKKGDCNDIESLIPVGKIDKNRMITIVNKIQPKGKTPIARSLKKVSNELKYTEDKATIILISDGKETCDSDPCAVAKELEQKGIDFVTHVIGFNVDKKTDKQLECIANATGGEYFSAKNATALNSAMKSIVKKVEKVEPKPKSTPTPKDTLELSCSEKDGGKWVTCGYAIYQDEEGKAGKHIATYRSYKNKIAKAQLSIGKYILKSTYNKFKKETPFEIKAGEVTKLHIVFGETSTVEITASETKNGKWINASHAIYEDDDGKAGRWRASPNSSKKKAGTSRLPVGKYILKSTYNEFKKETPFELKAGEVTKLHIIFTQFSIGAKCNDINTKVNYEIYAKSGRMVYEKRLVCSKSFQISLDEGDYSVEGKTQKGTKEEKFTVGGNNNKRVILDFTNIDNHKDLIDADNQNSSSTKEEEAMRKKEEIEKVAKKGNKLVKEIDNKSSEEIKKAGDLINVLGGLVQGLNQQVQGKQKKEKTKEDKEFEDMSKNLDMFTK